MSIDSGAVQGSAFFRTEVRDCNRGRPSGAARDFYSNRYFCGVFETRINACVVKGMEHRQFREKSIRYVILAMAIAGIIVGVARREPKVVLRKAANICFECIGIG